MTFGEKVKELRVKNGLSQRELGERMGGITQQTVAQYEKAIEQPKLATVQKIANALEVDINSLLNIEVEKGFIKPTNSLDFLKKPKTTIETTDENFVKIANNYYKLNKEGREKALDLVELLTKVSDYHRDETEE